MKWHAQVVHVLRKDLHLSRWLLLAYAAVVLGATAVAAGWVALAAESAPLWTLLLILLGMILLALLVQADSPQRSNAYWVTLPLHRSAVFAAKVAGAILFLLVLPLAGQLVGLSAHAVAAGDLPVLLARSALVYGAWLGLAAAIAALTPDLRTFAVALALVMVGWLVALVVLSAFLDPAPASPSPARLLGPAMAVGGTLFVLAHQYRTRNVGRGAWIAALVGIAVLALPPAVGRSAPAAHSASGSIPDSLRPATLDVRDVRFQPGGETMLNLRLRGLSASRQYLLVSPAAHLHMPDGSSVRVEIQSAEDPYVWLNDPVPSLDERLTWLGERVPPREFIRGVQVDLTPDQRVALARGDAWLTVRGHLEVREARVRADLPLETGATAAFDGRQVRVLEVENVGEVATVRLRVSSVASPGSAEAATPLQNLLGRSTRYALVNPQSHEAIALSERSTSGSSFGLVLPGAQTWTTTRSLQRDPVLSDVRVGNDWLRHARILLMDWVPVGSDPVLIQTTPLGPDPQRRGRVDVAR